MKRLFKVCKLSDNKAAPVEDDNGNPVWFSNREAAKWLRNEMNSQEKSVTYKVARGPDHWKGEQ